MKRICLVEDEKSLSDMIRLNLEMDGFHVDVYENGLMAKNAVPEIANYDLVILDVMLPQISGLEICDALRKISRVPILFLSAKGTTIDRIAGLKQGGNDYLAKPFDLEELLLRVQILLKNNDVEQVSTLIIGQKSINFSTFEITNTETNEIQILSKKEIELLKLFQEKNGMVISRDEILDKIWGDQFPTSRTIDNYILSFRKIFEDDPKKPVYFHSIRSVGYKFTANPENDY